MHRFKNSQNKEKKRNLICKEALKYDKKLNGIGLNEYSRQGPGI